MFLLNKGIKRKEQLEIHFHSHSSWLDNFFPNYPAKLESPRLTVFLNISILVWLIEEKNRKMLVNRQSSNVKIIAVFTTYEMHPFLQMRFQMAFQITRTNKYFVTQITFKRLLSDVNSYMIGEAFRKYKTHFTMLAFVRFLFPVGF